MRTMLFSLITLLFSGLLQAQTPPAPANPEAIPDSWRAAIAGRLEAAGRTDDAASAKQGSLPADWTAARAGNLGLVLAQPSSGITLESLFDLDTGTELSAKRNAPLFTIVLRRPGEKEDVSLSADTGWQSAKITKETDGLSLRWENPSDARFAGIGVVANARANAAQSTWRWTLSVENSNKEWSIYKTVFPQLALAKLSEQTALFFPRGPGEEQRDVWKEAFSYRNTYPSGWGSMQFMALYNDQPATGLYFGLHDPLGSTKDITTSTDPARQSARLAFEIPAPNMGVAANGFRLTGEAVWQLMRGNWFDAAQIYKTWARANARWWPVLTVDGREDTPMWLRELCAWAQTGGAPAECVDAVKGFQKMLDVPSGFHWYNWHQIPFDNDYPHYFPPKDGFADAVRDLQQSNVFVMPYINGRLWDTRDKGIEDFEFSRVALPAATKQENGEPYTETYASKESDGSPVRLAVMCPTTLLWQAKVKEIVLGLQQDQGVKGVYIDQIAAASPVLCMDKSHGHALGGGAYWTDGYWHMLDRIREAKPKDSMLTTECNGEPFVRWLDAYLTWHWQNNGQVPAFPAVYGGAIQMFGRNYGAGPTKDLALRMKAGQQLVFGEQIGWINPALAGEKENADFFRQTVQLRWRLRRYFYAGEMARPPKLIGEIPTVRADWQWNGEWWVTTDAVLTGAWRIPQEKKLVFMFVNVSDAPVTSTVHFDGKTYDVSAPALHVDVEKDREGVVEAFETPNPFDRPVTFAPRTAIAWEFHE